MGKLMAKVILMLAIILGISSYVFYLRTGNMPFSFSTASLPSPSLSDLKPRLPANKDTAYKWTDGHGAVHYSSEPPPETAKTVKKMEVDPDTNMVQSLKPTSAPSTKAAQTNPQQKPQTLIPANAKQLLEDTKNVQTLMDERYKRQKKAMGD